MKVITVIGARPQFIKAAVVSREIRKQNRFEEVLVHTGQHYDDNMSKVFFEELEIPVPKYNLNIHEKFHGASTGKMLLEIEKVLQDERPDALMVYGDTNSTLAGALAAKKLGIRVVHVEAGLRSYNNTMPEEINRILTDRISDLLFCPSDHAVQNLHQEGFGNFPVVIMDCGDVMKDSVIHFKEIASSKSTILDDLKVQKDHYNVATIHRQENTEDREKLGEIISALNEIAKQETLICPLHPRTKNKLESLRIHPVFQIVEPLGYLDMIQLVQHSGMILTDSGGLQKEAYFLEKKCITLREETEWTELVDHGYNKIAGTTKEGIINAYDNFKNENINFSQTLYGDGHAATTIVNTICRWI